MTNKLVIGILILLVILSCGLGYFSYTLNQQVNYLSEQATVFQMEQIVRIDTLSSQLTTLRGETMLKIDRLENKIDENLSRIGTLEDKTDENMAMISDLKAVADENLAKIDILEGEIRDATKLPQSMIDASEVYQKVSQATVRISNGETVVGSGFILDDKFHVVTAHHVVDSLSKIYVVLPDGRVSTAVNVGNCLYSDVAVLTLEDKLAVEPPTIADSTTVKIGEPVAAIGNPFDLTETITTGIVSQLNRFVDIQYDSQTRWVANLIQFDAAVNFGNSGCPLMNSKGEVIGMVIARIEPDRGDGIYHAVSSNKLKRVTASIIAQGYFDYPWLGISIANLTPQMAQNRALATANGALVEEVIAGSPADAAGIEADDIVTAIDGVAVNNVAELTSYLGEHKSPGETATITLIRDTNILELSTEIGKRLQ
ncbi:trypsin-like peptidase domain-containing protein [Chloroflexota bacterium]